MRRYLVLPAGKLGIHMSYHRTVHLQIQDQQMSFGSSIAKKTWTSWWMRRMQGLPLWLRLLLHHQRNMWALPKPQSCNYLQITVYHILRIWVFQTRRKKVTMSMMHPPFPDVASHKFIQILDLLRLPLVKSRKLCCMSHHPTRPAAMRPPEWQNVTQNATWLWKLGSGLDL